MISLDQTEPVCGKCGDRGFAVALVCCFMCHDAYEHCYCFNKASDIFREDIKWACEDCLPTNPKKHTIKKTRNLPSRRSERLSAKNLPAENAGSATKPARSSATAKRTMQKSESSHMMELLELHNSAGTTVCNKRRSCNLAGNESKDNEIPFMLEGKASKLLNERLYNVEAKDFSGGTLWIDLPRSPTFDDNLHAQPIMKPIWKGSFRISYKRFRKVEGVAAHLSSLACPKAQQGASLLPIVLHPDMVPTSTVWPKSFQEAEPKGKSIGLYFFPESHRDEAYDSLVDDMMSNDLAMICVVENAELLVFTSIKLPYDYWRFQGKRYLWGVFRAKQAPLSSQSPSGERP